MKTTTVLLTAKEVPDLDGVACAEVYQRLLQSKDPACLYEAAYGTGMHIEAAFVCQQLGITPKIIQNAQAYNQFILLDMCELKGAVPGVRGEDVIECIDHRLFPDYKSMPKANFRIEPVGAAATLIAEMVYFGKTPLSAEHAALLMCAIRSNTVNFHADVTTFRDHRMNVWLETVAGERYINLPEKMFAYKSTYALDHLEEVLDSDAKLCNQFNLGSEVVVYQIETSLADQTMSRLDEVLACMERLYPTHMHRLLIVQDITRGVTRLLTTTSELQRILENIGLPIQATDHRSQILLDKVYMRKSILQAALDSQK